MKKILGFFTLIAAIACNSIAMEAPVSNELERQVEAQKRLDSNLIRAIRAQNLTQVSQWLANGANVYAKDESGKTALEIASDTSNASIVGLVYAKVERKKPETYLKAFPREVQSEIEKFVVDDVNRARTIEEAIKNTKNYIEKNPEFVAKLIKDKFGQDVLDQELILASGWNLDLAKILIMLGANLNAVSNRFKETPIIIAASSGLNDLVQELLNKGANVNAQSVNGFTALINATNIRQ